MLTFYFVKVRGISIWNVIRKDLWFSWWKMREELLKNKIKSRHRLVSKAEATWVKLKKTVSVGTNSIFGTFMIRGMYR